MADGRFLTRLQRLETRAYGGRRRPAALAGAVIDTHAKVATITFGEHRETVTQLQGESAVSFRERVKGLCALKGEKVAVFTQGEFSRALKRERNRI